MISGVKAQNQTLDEIERLEESGMEALRNRCSLINQQSFLVLTLLFQGVHLSFGDYWSSPKSCIWMCPTKDGQGRLPCSSWKVTHLTQVEFWMAVEYYVMISDMLTGPRRRPQSCSRIKGMLGHSFSGLSDPVYVSDSIITLQGLLSLSQEQCRESPHPLPAGYSSYFSQIVFFFRPPLLGSATIQRPRTSTNTAVQVQAVQGEERGCRQGDQRG